MGRPDEPREPAPAEQAGRLRLSEARYRTLFEHAPEALVVLDADAGCFVEVNAEAEALFGLDRSVLRQHNPGSVSPPTQPDGRDSQEKADEYLAITFERGSHTFEWLHVCGDGEFMLVEQRPRMQSRGEVVPLAQGEAVVFAVSHRPRRGVRGYHRAVLRHGVSRIRSGVRHTLGIIFHDAR